MKKRSSKAIEFQPDQTCPKCGEVMFMMYGANWDYDRLICSGKDCDFEVGFETSTDAEDLANVD